MAAFKKQMKLIDILKRQKGSITKCLKPSTCTHVTNSWSAINLAQLSTTNFLIVTVRSQIFMVTLNLRISRLLLGHKI